MFRSLFTTLRHGDAAPLLLLVLLWSSFLVLIGIVIEVTIPEFPNPNIASPVVDFGWLNHTYGWDSGWYMGIILENYHSSPFSPSFFPVFPYSVVALHSILHGLINYGLAGLIVNTVSTWLAVVALFKTSKLLLQSASRYVHWVVVSLFLFSPAGFFLHVFYSEAIFCAIAFWAYYFALRRQWLYTALLLAILTATRVTAILFIVLCSLEFCRAYNWQIRKILNKNILWFALAPLGIIAYAFLLNQQRGSYVAMVHSYSAWTYHIFNLNFIGTYLDAISVLFMGVFLSTTPYSPHELFVNFGLPVIALSVLLFASLGAIFKVKKWGIPLGIFGLLSFAMFTLNSNVNSVHRYILTCLVIYIIVGYYLQRHKQLIYPVAFILLCGFGLQIILYTLFIKGYFAG